MDTHIVRLGQLAVASILLSVFCTVGCTTWQASLDHPKATKVGAASGFAGDAAARRDTGNTRIQIIGAADLYVSDFGEHALVPNRFQRDETALCLDFEYLAISYLRNIHSIPLSKTGDSSRSMMLAEYTLEVQNELASGKVTDLTLS